MKMKRVLVVDDEFPVRHGIPAALAGDSEVQVIDAINHDDALLRSGWGDIDVVLLDAGNPQEPDDNIPGAVVAEHIRASSSSEAPVIIVLTQFFREDSVRIRMAGAGAQFMYDKNWVMQEPSRLREVILDPQRGVPPIQQPKTFEEMGLVSGTDPNAVVAVIKGTIKELGIDSAWLEHDVERRPLDKRSKPTRNAFAKIGARVARYTGLAPRTADGGYQRSSVEDPTLPQIRRIWTKLTRLQRDE
jgi:CheY-like chemotaxis protein